MDSFKITILALSRSIDLEFKSDKLIEEFKSDIMFSLAKDIDYENKTATIESLQINTLEIRNKFSAIVDKYKNLEVKMNQINSYFKDLKDDEYFFIFPNSIKESERFQCYNYLTAKAEGKDYQKVANEINNLFGNLQKTYSISAFDENTKIKIGEPDKSKRVCRFCKKGNDLVSFKKIAHAISEGLGNKKIIGYDECDECNDKFGSGIESELISYLDLFRMFFGIKGKNGIPKLKGKNYEIENNGTIEIKHFLQEGEESNESEDDLKKISLNLKSNQKITNQNLYKALCKFAISVVKNEDLPHFKETIDWINGTTIKNNLPKVAMLKSYDLFAHHPKLVIYTRKTEEDLPFSVAEFRFTFLTFVFIIPFSDKDTINYLKEDDYLRFWEFFKHYNSVKNWEFLNLSDKSEKPLVMNLNMQSK